MSSYKLTLKKFHILPKITRYECKCPKCEYDMLLHSTIIKEQIVLNCFKCGTDFRIIKSNTTSFKPFLEVEDQVGKSPTELSGGIS